MMAMNSRGPPPEWVSKVEKDGRWVQNKKYTEIYGQGLVGMRQAQESQPSLLDL